MNWLFKKQEEKKSSIVEKVEEPQASVDYVSPITIKFYLDGPDFCVSVLWIPMPKGDSAANTMAEAISILAIQAVSKEMLPKIIIAVENFGKKFSQEHVANLIVKNITNYLDSVNGDEPIITPLNAFKNRGENG